MLVLLNHKSPTEIVPDKQTWSHPSYQHQILCTPSDIHLRTYKKGFLISLCQVRQLALSCWRTAAVLLLCSSSRWFIPRVNGRVSYKINRTDVPCASPQPSGGLVCIQRFTYQLTEQVAWAELIVWVGTEQIRQAYANKQSFLWGSETPRLTKNRTLWVITWMHSRLIKQLTA